MNTTNKDFLIKHGFVEDTNKEMLIGLFTNNKKFKQVDISVHFTKPVMLLARSEEKNVNVDVNSVQDNRLILKNDEKCSTVIMNILLDEINNCLFKYYGDGLYELEFEVKNLRYSLQILLLP